MQTDETSETARAPGRNLHALPTRKIRGKVRLTSLVRRNFEPAVGDLWHRLAHACRARTPSFLALPCRAHTLLSARVMRTSLLASVTIAMALIACGGRVDDGSSSGSTTNAPASSTEPTPGGGSSSGGSSGGTTGNGPGSARPSDPAESCDLACDEGHAIIQGTIACSAEGACYTRTVCGNTFVCDGPKGLCDEPQCLGYTVEVKTCPPGATCETQRLCDRTLICEKTDAQCDGIPACDEEDEDVASATECAKQASRCYARTACGGRIYCVRAL